MKKSILGIMIVTISTIILCSCGKPQYMTNETYTNACHALEVMDKYNSIEISKEEAQGRLKSIKISLEKEKEKLTEKSEEYGSNYAVIIGIEQFNDTLDDGFADTYRMADELRKFLNK